MKYIVYINGYYLVYEHVSIITHKKYGFRKNFATQIDDLDYEYFLELTAQNVPWCPYAPKTLAPFKSLDKYCEDKGISCTTFLKDFIWV